MFFTAYARKITQFVLLLAIISLLSCDSNAVFKDHEAVSYTHLDVYKRQPGEFFVPEDSPSLTTGSEPFTLEQTCTQPGPSVAPDFPVWNGTTYQVYISSDHLNLVVISPPLPGLRSLVFERRPNEA